MMFPRFANRVEAGRLLAERLKNFADRSDVIILALPRGGVPVAFEIAQTLHVALDIFLVRKLGVPGHRELAMGAIATGGVRVLNDEVVGGLDIPPRAIDAVAQEEQRELERREQEYRGPRPAPEVSGRTVVIVDDGLATGSTMRAAVAALRRQQPNRIVVAVPVAPPSTCQELRAEADEVVCLATPEPFSAVGLWYRDFSETSDAEVRDLLARAVTPRQTTAS